MTSRLREYVASFRIRELSQSLEQLGLSKRGRKLELQNRLLTYLGDSQPPPGINQPAAEAWKRNEAGRQLASPLLAQSSTPMPRRLAATECDSLCVAERVITQIWIQMHGRSDDQQLPQNNVLAELRER